MQCTQSLPYIRETVGTPRETALSCCRSARQSVHRLATTGRTRGRRKQHQLAYPELCRRYASAKQAGCGRAAPDRLTQKSRASCKLPGRRCEGARLWTAQHSHCGRSQAESSLASTTPPHLEPVCQNVGTGRLPSLRSLAASAREGDAPSQAQPLGLTAHCCLSRSLHSNIDLGTCAQLRLLSAS